MSAVRPVTMMSRAVDEVQVAVLVLAGDVPAAEPAVGVEDLGGAFGVSPVALHDHGTVDVQLAGVPHGHELAVLAPQLHLDAGPGTPAAGQQLGPPQVVFGGAELSDEPAL
ncbi:hypothetical protein GCM10010245_22230 [Streptomyces spectabilis]|nr:hypothetical protein GCM10010245_22230 [Streptomyces spectabilis]